MDVRSNCLEKASKRFKNEFNKLFFNGYSEITHTKINLTEGYVSTLPSDYQWHIYYWENNLDLHLNERCTLGIHSWNDYSEIHKSIIENNDKNIIKLDICSKKNHEIELFSVSKEKNSTLSDLSETLRLKAFVGHYAHMIRNELGDDIAIPLRKQITENRYSDIQFENEYPYSYFNGIKFTSLEMMTISLLLQLKTVKEIATSNGCSETAEKNRINRIKQKMNCENKPLSKLFSSLRENGVTGACLKNYIMFL